MLRIGGQTTFTLQKSLNDINKFSFCCTSLTRALILQEYNFGYKILLLRIIMIHTSQLSILWVKYSILY